VKKHKCMRSSVDFTAIFPHTLKSFSPDLAPSAYLYGMPDPICTLEEFESVSTPDSKKMGISAGLTYHFTLSQKLRNKDPLTIFIDKTPYNKRVKNWIEEYPQIIWYLVYGKDRNKPVNLSLCRDALDHLKSKISEVNPRLLEDLEKRKRGHAFKNRLATLVNR